MVAIFTGAGSGFERGSGSVLGSPGLLGQASLGRNSEQLLLNAATGNLLISQQDEFLIGRGPDSAISRIYNSLGNLSDDNGDNWRQSTDRRVHSLTGTVNTAGSTVKRVSSDGSEILYTWDWNAYVATDGSGSYDKLTCAAGLWTWTDGSSQMRETYEASGAYWRLKQQIDTDGNTLTFGYTGGKLTRITTSDGSYTDYAWSGNNVTQITTTYTDLATSTVKTLTRTRYSYDASNRLTTVTVDLSPEDNNIADGKTYVTTYTYDGTSKRVSSVAQTDGSRIDIAYDWAGRVSTLVETASTGVTRTTSIGYNAGYTTVTDPAGQVTTLHFSAPESIASPVDFWAQGNVIREAGTINGAAATKFTVQTTGWAGISHGIDVAAGDTVTFGLTLQAVGTVTSQSLGLYSGIDGWGAAGISSARIVSGPGQLSQYGGLWTVSGLSTTQATRIEVTRTYKQAESAGAYFYVDHPGGYRGGTSLLVQDATLVKSATATDVAKMDVNNWYTANLTKTAAGTIDGGNAYKYTVQSAGGWSALSTNLAAARGDSYSFSISLKADGIYTSQQLGLYGSSSDWGTDATSSARIVAGPGTITRTAGGLFQVSGLSTTQATRIEVTRTYEEDENGWAYVYVDLPGNHRAGASLIASAAQLTKRIAPSGAANQLLKITAPPAYSGAAAQVVDFGYDGKGNLISVKDAEGNETWMSYTGSGNVLLQSDRLGNVVSRSYDSKNQLLAETSNGSNASSADAQHTTRYVYDGESHLRYAVGAAGNVIEYRYTAAGELEYTIEYPEHFYDVSGLAAYNMLTETDLNAWRDGIADRSSTKISRNLYDARGNLVSTILYGIASAAGGASTTEGTSQANFTYDQAGRLLSTYAQGQNAQTYVYDGLGRLTAATDVNGGTTSIVFNDAATSTIVTLASGLVQTSTYNKAGELVSSTESGSFVAGGTASYKYDKLGRLRQVTDATGYNSYYLYDKAGRKIGEINHLGWLTEYRFDAHNRVVATTRYTNAVSSSALTQLGDPNSTVEMAAIRPAANSFDVWTWYVYDKEGRLIETIEGDGKVTALEYDKSGRLIKTTNYFNKLTATQIANLKTSPPSAPILPTANATKDSIARTFYDKEGRLIGALDGEGYLSRIIYDRAGQKVEEIAYLNATNSTYRGSGTLDQLVSTLIASTNDRRTRYVYDGQGLLRYEIDGLNQGVKFNYNAAGDLIGTTRYATAIAATSDYTYDNIKAMLAASGQADALTSRRTWLVHNAAGKVAYSVEGEGKVTAFAYDVSGNVKKQVEYAVARPPINIIPTLAEMDNWAAAQASNPLNRITRNYYTARNEQRFAVDAEGYVTRHDYDAEGRVLAEIRWNTAIAVNDADTISTVNGAVSGVYQSKSYSYDQSGNVAYAYDGEGNYRYFGYYANGTLKWDIAMYGHSDESRTLYEYDAAGRVKKEYRAHGTADQALVQYAYDGHGNLITTIDPNNNSTTRTYNRVGQLKTQTNALSGVTSYEYNGFGEVVKITDARSNASYSYYDKLGRVVSTRDAEGYVTETAYTVFSEVANVVRRYNKANNTASTTVLPTYTIHAKDALSSFEYDKLGRLTKMTDAENHYEQYTLDAFGQRTSVRNKLGAIVTNTYDRRGLLTSETLPMAVISTSGSASSVTNRFEYDARGNRTKTTEAYGLWEQRITTYVYDKADRLIETWGEPLGVVSQSDHATFTTVTPVERIKYDTRGNVIEMTDANGARALFYYNKLNQKAAELKATKMVGSDQVGTLSTFTYDKNGNMLTSRVFGTEVTLPAVAGGAAPTPPSGEVRLATYSYDKLNRLKTTSIAGVRTGGWDGTSYTTSVTTITSTLDYDSNGNIIKATDGNGGLIFSYYDKLGRKTAQVDQENYLTGWTLDVEGNVLTERRYATAAAGTIATTAPPAVATHADDRVTNFTYDKNGQRLTEQRTGVVAYSLDSGGNLVAASTTPTISYTYNGLGQVTGKTEATGESTDYGYDNMGRLMTEKKAGFADHTGLWVRPMVTYAYDGLNNLTSTRQGNETQASTDRITLYGYGAGGRLAWVNDAESKTHYYSYDAAGNVLRDDYQRQKSDGAYVQEGVLYTRDLLGRLTSQTVGSFNGSTWNKGDSQTLGYNAYGEMVSRGINGLGQESFHYDGAGRLWRSNAGDGVWRYFVNDANGNRTLTIESEGADLIWFVDSIEQVLAIATNNGANTVGAAYVDGINATINVYDKRGQARETRLPKRQLSGEATATTADLSVSRGYNAFGEVAWEKDARIGQSNITYHSYNTMGRSLSIQRPSVSITLENGTTQSVTPTDRFYYDVSGRLIGAEDANGNRTTRALLAGTGYGESEALVLREYHVDGGILRRDYDVFGDARMTWDEVDRRNLITYDKMGRVIQQWGPGGLTDYYTYDLLGQRLRHWNSLLGSSNVETTDYDVQGRIVSHVAFGGDLTTTSYSWSSYMVTPGMGLVGGGFGGWTQTTTFANGKTQIEQSDAFGHDLYKSDLGGHYTAFTYDMAGRMVQSTNGAETINYDYLNSGLSAAVWKGTGTPGPESEYDLTKTVYTYDEVGNRLTERYFNEGGYWIPEQYDPYNGYTPPQYVTYNTTYQNATATYDALARMTSWVEAGSTMPASRIDYEYDANGNVRRTRAEYRALSGNGTPSASVSVQDNWYRYDGMNRVVTAKGSLSGGQIVRGYNGADYLYDDAGQRQSVTRTFQAWASIPDPGSWDPYWGYNYIQVPYDAHQREDYSYDGNGNLDTVRVAESSYSDNGDGTVSPTPLPATGTVRADHYFDAMGRLGRQVDFASNGSTAVYDRSVYYNAKNQVSTDSTITKQGSDTITANNTYSYGSGTGYALGAVTSITTGNYKNGGFQNNSSTTNSYHWYDGAVQATVSHKPNTSQSTTHTTTYYYNSWGTLNSISVADGRPRSIGFMNDMSGQVLKRDEYDNVSSNGDPHEIWYRFNGKQLGYTGNNGTLDTDYQTSISNRTSTTGTGAFRFGTTTGSSHADFDLSVASINSYNQGSASGSYTVRTGDTLQSIAASLWGDASLWYKLAEANGMAAANALSDGQRLTVPAGVMKSHHNASTFKPYDPAEVIGDATPSTPKPAKKNKCATFGRILLTVIAIAVTAIVAPYAAALVGAGLGALGVGAGAAAAITTGVVGGAISSAAGSIVSQSIGVRTGILEEFSWKDVALAGISGAVSGGLGGGLAELGKAGGALGKAGRFLSSGGILGSAAQGAVGAALTQGIAMATTLQKKFDWVGVAAAGVSAGVGGQLANANPFVNQAASNSAGAITSAVALSLKNGTSFGDNLLAALPGVIGSTIGNGVVATVQARMARRQAERLIDAVRSIPGATESIELGALPLAAQMVNDTALARGIPPEAVVADPVFAENILVAARTASNQDATAADKAAAVEIVLRENLGWSDVAIQGARELAAQYIPGLAPQKAPEGILLDPLVVTGKTSDKGWARLLGSIGHFVADNADNPWAVGASYIIGAVTAPVNTAIMTLLDITPGVGDVKRKLEGWLGEKVIGWGAGLARRAGVRDEEAPFVAVGALAVISLAMMGPSAWRLAKQGFSKARTILSRLGRRGGDSPTAPAGSINPGGVGPSATGGVVTNLTERGTLTNLFPDDLGRLEHPSRLLVRDGSGRFWLENEYGVRHTPSGSYDFVTLPDGSIRVVKPNARTTASTHIALSRGGEVAYAGTIQFPSNNSATRGLVRSWSNNSGHYKPPPSLNSNAGLPTLLFNPWKP
jgi:YD repeat-containing protein